VLNIGLAQKTFSIHSLLAQPVLGIGCWPIWKLDTGVEFLDHKSRHLNHHKAMPHPQMPNYSNTWQKKTEINCNLDKLFQKTACQKWIWQYYSLLTLLLSLNVYTNAPHAFNTNFDLQKNDQQPDQKMKTHPVTVWTEWSTAGR